MYVHTYHTKWNSISKEESWVLFKHLYIKCVDNILSYFEVYVSFFCCVCMALRSANFKQQSDLYSSVAQGFKVGPKFTGVPHSLCGVFQCPEKNLWVSHSSHVLDCDECCITPLSKCGDFKILSLIYTKFTLQLLKFCRILTLLCPMNTV